MTVCSISYHLQTEWSRYGGTDNDPKNLLQKRADCFKGEEIGLFLKAEYLESFFDLWFPSSSLLLSSSSRHIFFFAVFGGKRVKLPLCVSTTPPLSNKRCQTRVFFRLILWLAMPSDIVNVSLAVTKERSPLFVSSRVERFVKSRRVVLLAW